MRPSRINPFPTGDADRHEIWDLMVECDILAFIAGDWSITSADFHAEGFVGHSGPSNPDHWQIRFPSLDVYKEEWLRQAKDFSKVQLKGIDKADFLFDATVLRDIEISGDHALAHKKFNGKAETSDGKDVILKWQTMYRLRRIEGKWKLTGFVGYLPNPMPDPTSQTSGASIDKPVDANQHRTAGPYSPVLKVKANEFVVISGQGPIDDNGEIVGTTIQEQTHVTMQNCVRQLRSGGASLTNVFRVTVYLSDMQEWAAFNEVYRTYVHEPFPARTAIQCVLWGGIQVEIDMWAVSR
jgi:reactive intermediate/imine deaminase